MKLLIFGMLMAFSINSYAQTLTNEQIKKTEHSIKRKGKYALLVRTDKHLKAAIKTGKALLEQSDKIDYQIVLCGALLKDLSTTDSLKELVKDATDSGLHVLLCGLSIQQLSLKTEDLPKSAQITENGLIYLWGLQENGYKTIAL